MPDQEARGSSIIVALPAQIDLTSRERAYDQLYAAFTSGAAIVIADFTGTTFCDCSNLRHLVAIQDRAAARDAELRLVIRPGSPVQRVAELMDLGRLLPVYPPLGEAVAGGTLPRRTGPGPPGRAARRTVTRIRRIVPLATQYPRPRSSPWMCRYPKAGSVAPTASPERAPGPKSAAVLTRSGRSISS